jgi:hypothetical protein
MKHAVALESAERPTANDGPRGPSSALAQYVKLGIRDVGDRVRSHQTVIDRGNEVADLTFDIPGVSGTSILIRRGLLGTTITSDGQRLRPKGGFNAG